MKYTRSYLRRLAAARAKDWGRDWNTDAYYIGLVGEAAFAEAFDCEIDTEIKDGDDGIDFELGGYTIDVKTYINAHNLPLETDRQCKSNILVLARYLEKEDLAVLIGWEYAYVMRKCPKRKFRKDGPINHYKAAGQLRPLDELKLVLG